MKVSYDTDFGQTSLGVACGGCGEPFFSFGSIRCGGTGPLELS